MPGTLEVPARLAAGCAEVRPAGPADAVGGVRASYVAAPSSTPEASAVLRAAAQLGLAVVARGAGTRLGWGLPPRRCDLIVDTGRLDAVLDHAAGDLVARVQAGLRLDQLAEVLAAAGQRLALDPPAGGAGGSSGTVGGLIATGVAGPLRLRYGAPRDLLIGITIVRADGKVARSGGKVVKNVAGYDFGKLMAGSYGTLGLITEATFRLHPRPAAVAHVSLACSGPAEAAAALLAAAGSAQAPVAAELDWPGQDAPLSVSVALEGDDPRGVAQRADRLRDQLGAAAGASASAPAWWGAGPAAASDATVLRIAFWAGRLAAVLADIRAVAAGAGLDPAVGGSGAAGVLHTALPLDAPPDAVARFVAGLRASLGAGPPDAGPPDAGPPDAGPPGGSVVVLHAPPQVLAAVDIWGPVPAAGLMRAVKDQFDPEHRMAPGRFAGGI